MKIIACIRTLNEEDNIEKCCKSYAEFCDEVLIADGGSLDRTVQIARSMPKTKIIHFTEKVECKNGIWRNPDYLHLMFLWEHAIKDGADWIISQDCDQRPNKSLKQDAREIFANMTEDFLLATQIYMWGKNRYFPELSKHGEWMQGLWAWRANLNLKVIDKMPHFEFSFDGEKSFDVNSMPERCKRILPPYCYMHFGWETEEKTDAHLEYYRNSGLIDGMLHPLDFGGRLAELEDWMVE